MHSTRKSKRSGPLPFQKRMSTVRSGRLLKASTATLACIKADADAREKRMARWLDDASSFASEELECARAQLRAQQAKTANHQSIADLACTGMNSLTQPRAMAAEAESSFSTPAAFRSADTAPPAALNLLEKWDAARLEQPPATAARPAPEVRPPAWKTLPVPLAIRRMLGWLSALLFRGRP